MNLNISEFFYSIKDKKIAFIGMGVSNLPTIRLFLSKNLNVTVLDKNVSQKMSKDGCLLSDNGAKFIVGDDYLKYLIDFDIVIRSPGMYFNNPYIINARKNGVVITSEIELFFLLCPCKIIAVTGSDGKTTTTSLIYEFLKYDGKRAVYLGGNIGLPIFPDLEKIKADDLVVLELSSFQLLSLRSSPDIAVITNISPNHLDVHANMEEYLFCKQNILFHQNAFSKTILNKDNSLTNQQEKYVRGEVLKFSRLSAVENGAYFNNKDNNFYFVKNNTQTLIMNIKDTSLIGAHNIENYLAAICCVYYLLDNKSIKSVCRCFKGVKHRNEFIGSINGIRWYNDSIATSPTRTIAALKSFDQKIILIAGGYDKNLSYAKLAPYIINKVKHLILLGDTADKIKQSILNNKNYRSHNPSIHMVNSLDQAVVVANELAVENDIVSLSPASASFDLYKNFEQRGNHFKSLVLKYKN